MADQTTPPPSAQPPRDARGHRDARRGGGRRDAPRGQGDGPQLIEKLISINRVAKVHKGGKRLAFNALAIVGDGKGRVGMALGKANEAAEAIRKGFTQAQRNMLTIPLRGSTIPHEIIGKSDASNVLLKPASPGTGIIAGGPVRAVCEACGIRDILTKSLGSSNAINLVKATLNGLQALEYADTIRERRTAVVEGLPS
jgi:small subunit ribosomal protein S5